MKLKLFSATVLLALTLSGCGAPSASSESKPDSSGSMAQKSESAPKSNSTPASSSSAPKSSGSSINTIPPFSSVPNSTGSIPTMPSPLDAEGKFPATGQVPEELMSQEFLRLFAYNSKPQIFINMTKEALKAMSDLQHDRNNRKFYDVYFPANFRLILDGRVYDYDEVGVRMKGNWSRKELVDFSGNNVARLSHLKISFKATFDDEILYNQPETRQFKKDWTAIPAEKAARKDRNLFGMDKLDLKYTPRNDSQGTGTQDNACIGREVYCYDRFREQDLLAPYSNLGTVTLNNGLSNKSGSMELIECVDKAFLKKRYSKADRKGNLYKCAKNVAGVRANFKGDNAIDKTGGTNGNAPIDQATGFEIGTRKAKGIIGVEDCFNGYDPVYQLKTNDDLGEGADFSDLAKVIARLHSIVSFSNISSANKLSALNSMLDMDSFLKFSAISYLLGNVDDQRNAGNNFYLYFVPSTKKMTFIAYDWDWCLGSAYDGKDMLTVNPLDTYVPEGGDENKDLGTSSGGGTSWGGGGTRPGGQTSEAQTTTTDDRAYTGYENNLFWSTILTPRSPKCDTTGSMNYVTGLQQTYLTYVKNLQTDTLNYTYFVSNITNNFKIVDPTLRLDDEKNKVNTYMSGKKTRLNAYFNAHPLPANN